MDVRNREKTAFLLPDRLCRSGYQRSGPRENPAKSERSGEKLQKVFSPFLPKFSVLSQPELEVKTLTTTCIWVDWGTGFLCFSPLERRTRLASRHGRGEELCQRVLGSATVKLFAQRKRVVQCIPGVLYRPKPQAYIPKDFSQPDGYGTSTPQGRSAFSLWVELNSESAGVFLRLWGEGGTNHPECSDAQANPAHQALCPERL